MQRDITEIKTMMTEISVAFNQFKHHSSFDNPRMLEYFPCGSDEQMEAFLNDDDGTLDEKTAAFEKYVFNAIHTKKSKSKEFLDHLIHMLFTRGYLGSHKWPVSTYVGKVKM